jgi:hypothetical protein
VTKNHVKTIKVSDIIFREDLYPRLEKNPVTVQKYAEDLSVLPPIEVNQRNELIDGWHRWTAHKKEKAEEILVTVTETRSDAELLELAIERNSRFGMQLSQNDKQSMARRIYLAAGDRKERMAVKLRLQRILSASAKMIEHWLSRCEKDLKEEAKKTAFDLWLACRTQDEIAEETGWPKMTINDWLRGMYENPEMGESVHTPDSDPEANGDAETPYQISRDRLAAADHATDFQVPIYNIWKQQEKTKGSSHFGNSEVRWLDNLLYFYTKPFDIVIDPFAGGGSTIELCKKRLRRYWVSDRKPVVERENEIRNLDLTEGLPDLRKRWPDVRLVYLDPPYWWQSKGQYSKNPTDLANMELEEFNRTLANLITGFGKKMQEGYIALLIQPTQWNAPEKQFTDHVGDMLRMVKLPVKMRFSCPYESQQCNAQMVEWAKENRECLVLTREMIVWQVSQG